MQRHWEISESELGYLKLIHITCSFIRNRGSNNLNPVRLKYPRFKNWLSESKDGQASCSMCAKNFNMLIIEVSAFQSHSKGKKHIESEQEIQFLSSLCFQPPIVLSFEVSETASLSKLSDSTSLSIFSHYDVTLKSATDSLKAEIEHTLSIIDSFCI